MLASPCLCEGRAILTPNNSIKSLYERVVISREQRCKTRCPCRDGGVNEIDPGFARLHRSKRDSHIDPPTCSNALMQRAQPYCGENSEPGRHITESLTSNPRVREQSSGIGFAKKVASNR